MAFIPVKLRELRVKFGIELNRNNDMFCPFCSDGTGRKLLHFNDSTDTWRCSKCEASGGVLDFFCQYYLGCPLPEDKSERKKIKQEMYKLLGREEDQMTRPEYTTEPPKPQKKAASDTQVHTVYSAMASLAVFHLTADHKKELKRRGLTSAQIERNGYRSFPYQTNIPSDIVDLYRSVDPALRAEHTDKDAAHTQLGLLVARMLEEKGYDLDGVPGFYRFGNHWCLTYLPGIMIPTRNIHGQIVLWQVRKKYGEPKYVTLSCGKKPGAVEADISRCHFTRSGGKLSPEVKVIITEGPLKADVAAALTTDPCVFASIPGIGNRKDLLANCKALLDAGITEVYNALDMDRLTNPSVRNASNRLSQELEAQGLKLIPMYWGEEYAATQLMIYQSIAKNRHVSIPPHDYRISVYEKLSIVAEALHQVGIVPGKHWESETKGIDDYLFSQIQRKQHSHTSRINHMREYHKTLLEINSTTKSSH